MLNTTFFQSLIKTALSNNRRTEKGFKFEENYKTLTMCFHKITKKHSVIVLFFKE